MTNIPSLDSSVTEFSGGRRVGQLDVTPEFAAEFAKMTPEQQQELIDLAARNEVAEYYGGYAAFLDHPEVGPILRRAADEGWAPRKLKYELMRTKWWTQVSDSQKAWDGFVATNGGVDSATVQKAITQKSDELGGLSASFGVRLSEEQTKKLALDALRNGWTDRETALAVANEIRLNPVNVEGLRTGQIGRQLKDTASKFAVPMSDSKLDEWLNSIIDGKTTTEDFDNWVRGQARGLYPSLAADIDRGLDVATLTDPFRQVAANTLGIIPEDIDFADPKWNTALNFDDGKGRRMMTLFEWGEHLRRDERYGYDRTPGARDKAYRMVSDLGRMFGLSA